MAHQQAKDEIDLAKFAQKINFAGGGLSAGPPQPSWAVNLSQSGPSQTYNAANVLNNAK